MKAVHDLTGRLDDFIQSHGKRVNVLGHWSQELQEQVGGQDIKYETLLTKAEQQTAEHVGAISTLKKDILEVKANHGAWPNSDKVAVAIADLQAKFDKMKVHSARVERKMRDSGVLLTMQNDHPDRSQTSLDSIGDNITEPSREEMLATLASKLETHSNRIELFSNQNAANATPYATHEHAALVTSIKYVCQHVLGCCSTTQKTAHKNWLKLIHFISSFRLSSKMQNRTQFANWTPTSFAHTLAFWRFSGQFDQPELEEVAEEMWHAIRAQMITSQCHHRWQHSSQELHDDEWNPKQLRHLEDYTILGRYGGVSKLQVGEQLVAFRKEQPPEQQYLTNVEAELLTYHISRQLGLRNVPGIIGCNISKHGIGVGSCAAWVQRSFTPLPLISVAKMLQELTSDVSPSVGALATSEFLVLRFLTGNYDTSDCFLNDAASTDILKAILHNMGEDSLCHQEHPVLQGSSNYTSTLSEKLSLQLGKKRRYCTNWNTIACSQQPISIDNECGFGGEKVSTSALLDSTYHPSFLLCGICRFRSSIVDKLRAWVAFEHGVMKRALDDPVLGETRKNAWQVGLAFVKKRVEMLLIVVEGCQSVLGSASAL